MDAIPVNFVPTPTNSYRSHRKLMQATAQPGRPILPTTKPLAPPVRGPRALIWKQDPSVADIGIRKVFLPNLCLAGPRDARIMSQGLPTVSPNADGDFIQTPDTDAFNAVHTFAVVRMTLNLAQRALAALKHPMPWQWSTPQDVSPLQVFPHGLPGTMNAFYSRNQRALRFGDFDMPGSRPLQRVFTCRSFDIVSHETGHAILDGLKPQWLDNGNPPQTGGLHESFGDLTAIFLTLSQMDQVEAIIAYTKADLHAKTFLADIAEQFGLALGRPNGLRNADNDLKLSETGTEVHAISQVFTGAVYDVMADIFDHECSISRDAKDPAQVLFETARYVYSLLLQGILASPDQGATFADVARAMIDHLTGKDKKHATYRDYIWKHFAVREVLSTQEAKPGMRAPARLTAGVQDAEDAEQDRRTCCGTMRLGEYHDEEKALADEARRFAAALGELQSNGNGR